MTPAEKTLAAKPRPTSRPGFTGFSTFGPPYRPRGPSESPIVWLRSEAASQMLEHERRQGMVRGHDPYVSRLPSWSAPTLRSSTTSG